MRYSGKRCDTGELATVSVEDGRIAAVKAGGQAGSRGGPDVWLAPGFIDLQVNGHMGHDFNLGAWVSAEEAHEGIAPIFASLARGGTPVVCPTVTTNSREAMLAALRRLGKLLDRSSDLGAAVPGIHVEGPYLAGEDGPRGAHPREHVRDPDWDEFRQFQEAAGGRIRILTLAPEREGALPFIERLAESGVIPGLGHTGAAPEVIRSAVRAGARLSTHLGNGAHATLPRHPNYIWEQLACDELYATIITDGDHLPPAVAKCMARVKGPEKLALVSDVVSLGGMPPGRYHGGRHEVLESGKIVVSGTPYLAGAGFLLDRCAANALRFTDLTLAQVVACASTIPARILGIEERKGHLRPGYDADLTLFRLPAPEGPSGPLEIVATVRAGEEVYHS